MPFAGISRRRLRLAVERTCEMADLSETSVSVILTDDREIRELNKRYRKKNRPTDVISFAYREDPFPSVVGAPETLGDVYISLERAAEQARHYGVAPAEELLRLLVHGILHLAGYDHERSVREETKMRNKEDEILARLTRRLSSRSDPT